jgi:hypothetical protein
MTWYKRSQLRPDPGNSVLSNKAYQVYKDQESDARSFQVLPSSDTRFLVTTAQGFQYIIDLLPVTLDRLIGYCSYRKYDDYMLSYNCVYFVSWSRSFSLFLSTLRLEYLNTYIQPSDSTDSNPRSSIITWSLYSSPIQETKTWPAEDITYSG